jgi:hypothetical protein
MITRRRLVVLTAGFAAGALLASAGLAAAGVSLPAVARAPFERVGIELPNQGAAGDVHAVIDAPTDQRGCAFGQAVARAATGGKAGPSGDPCLRQNGEGGQDPGSAPHDSSADQGAGRAFGQRTAADAQASASQDGRAFGERTSQDAQELGQGEPATDGTPGQEHSQSGDAIANEQSEAGQAIGQQHSENGASPQTGSPTGGGGSGGSQPSSGGAP